MHEEGSRIGTTGEPLSVAFAPKRVKGNDDDEMCLIKILLRKEVPFSWHQIELQERKFDKLCCMTLCMWNLT